MSLVLEFFSDLSTRITAAEAVTLLGLLLVAVLGIALPVVTMRRKQSYRTRDSEFRRLQNM